MSNYRLADNQTAFFLSSDIKLSKKLASCCESLKKLGGMLISCEQEPSWLSHYQGDAQNFKQRLPLAVYEPENSQQLQKAVKICNELNISITTRGTGATFSGQALPPQEGLVISLAQLNQITRCSEFLQVEAGVTLSSLKNYAVQNDLFLPIFHSQELEKSLEESFSSCKSIFSQRNFQWENYTKQVSFIDGQGSLQTSLPDSLCAMEGTMGVITSLKLKLPPNTRNPYNVELKSSLLTNDHITFLREIPCVESLITYFDFQDSKHFFINAFGEEWSLTPLLHFLKKEKLIKENINSWIAKPLPSKETSSYLFGLLPTKNSQRAQIEEKLKKLASSTIFDVEISWDWITGNLCCYLGAPQKLTSPHLHFQNFCISWVNFLESEGGHFQCFEGLGTLFDFLTPCIYTEPQEDFLKFIKTQRDANNIISSEKSFSSTSQRVLKQHAKNTY
jgi:hypothetical protein